MENKWTCYAACSFGLEAVVARELERLGAEDIHAQDAKDLAVPVDQRQGIGDDIAIQAA